MIPWGKTMWSVKAKQKFWNVPYYSNYHGYEYKKSESEVTQLCPTLCDPMNCSLPGSSVHGIFHARILEWVAISFSRGSSRPSDQTRVSRIAGRHFTNWATREAPSRCWEKRFKHNRMGESLLLAVSKSECFYASWHFTHSNSFFAEVKLNLAFLNIPGKADAKLEEMWRGERAYKWRQQEWSWQLSLASAVLFKKCWFLIHRLECWTPSWNQWSGWLG